MTPFRRQAEPGFWGAYERRWLYQAVGKKVRPLHDWEAEPTEGAGRRSLAAWFHALLRAEGEPSRCAYCDGPLGTESPETIDHHIPQSACRELALTWGNLYPACSLCNTSFKGTRWSCSVVRPDRDPVDAWFDFEAETGRLTPAPDLDRRTQARVRLTIALFGLNTKGRCTQRRQFLRRLELALCTRDVEYLVEAKQNGPYRFITTRFFLANRSRMGWLV